MLFTMIYCHIIKGMGISPNNLTFKYKSKKDGQVRIIEFISTGNINNSLYSSWLYRSLYSS